MIDINGIAHIQLTVRDVGRSKPFYRRLLHETFGMTIQYDEPEVFYCIGGRTGLLITPAAAELRDEPYHQRRIGLHHLCFRLRSREDIDKLHAVLLDMNAKIVHPPEDGPWAPGYPRGQLCSRPRQSRGHRREAVGGAEVLSDPYRARSAPMAIDH